MYEFHKKASSKFSILKVFASGGLSCSRFVKSKSVL